MKPARKLLLKREAMTALGDTELSAIGGRGTDLTGHAICTWISVIVPECLTYDPACTWVSDALGCQ